MFKINIKQLFPAAFFGFIFLNSCSIDYGQKFTIQESTFTSAWQEEGVPAEKGWIRVPACYNSEECTETVRIPFVRIKSISSEPDPPVFYFAGGPGDSGIQSAKRGVYAYLMEFRKTADVILFDQRGTGDSKPDLTINTTFNIPFDAPLNSEPALDAIRSLLVDIRSEVNNQGVDLNWYNTRNNAIDIDSLRSILGYKDINIFAHSYGTHLAMAYLNRFDHRVNRVIFSGANGLDDRFILPEDSENFLRRVYDSSRNNQKFNRLFSDFWDNVSEVLNKYENGFTIGDTLYFNSFDIQAITMLRSGDSDFVYSLPKFYLDLKNEDFEEFAEILSTQFKKRPAGTAMTYSMASASGISDTRRMMIEEQKENTIMGNARNYPFYHVNFTDQLGIEDLGEEFREFGTTEVPVLFLNGTFDGRTPLEDADRLQTHFKKSIRVVVDGASHDVLFSTPKLIEISTDFFAGTELHDQNPEIFYEFKSLQEDELLSDLVQTYNQEGIEGVTNRIDEMLDEDSEYYLTSDILVLLGNVLIDEMKFKDALHISEFSYTRFPGNSMLVNNIGLAHLRLSNTEESTKHALQFSSMNPFDRRWAFILNSRGIALHD